jgi:hypothetical protein
VRAPQILGWSPDSTRIAVTASTALESRIYILQPRRPQRVIARVSAARGGIGVGAWSPDGRIRQPVSEPAGRSSRRRDR